MWRTTLRAALPGPVVAMTDGPRQSSHRAGKLYVRRTQRWTKATNTYNDKGGKETEQQTVASQVLLLWGARDSERLTQRKQTRNDVCSADRERPLTMHRWRDAEVRGPGARSGMQRNSFLLTNYVHGEIHFLIASSALLRSREVRSGGGWRQSWTTDLQEMN